MADNDRPTPVPPPSPGSAAPSGPPPSGPPPSGPPPAPGGAGAGRSRTMMAVAIAVVVALVGAGLVAVSLSGGDGDDDIVVAAGSGEVFLEPAASVGADPFFDDFGTLVEAEPATFVPGTVPPADDLPSNQEVLAEAFAGTEPGLYGGTGNNESCNRQALVSFLEENPDKAAAWAAVHEIDPSEIRVFVSGLTTAQLRQDTRVTNHGFRNGVANPIQSVLQAGTAVMVDSEGVPRAKCGCGNPLAKPVAQLQRVTYRGPAWSGFTPQEVVTVDPGPETDEFILVDVDTGGTIMRPAGEEGAAADVVTSDPAPEPEGLLEDAAESAATTAAPATTAPTSSTTTTSTTTTSTTSTTTTTPRVEVDMTARGTVSANSTFTGFPAGLAVDGSAATSWFSTGPGVGDAIFTWSGPSTEITMVSFIGNGGHEVPDFRTGFGFSSATVEILDGESVVWSSDGSGFGDSWMPPPGTVGSVVRLIFTGHESIDCGGFAELTIRGLE